MCFEVWLAVWKFKIPSWNNGRIFYSSDNISYNLPISLYQTRTFFWSYVVCRFVVLRIAYVFSSCYFVSKCFKACTEKEKVFIRFIICFMLAFVSAAMRDTFGINIPKVSNTLSAIVLICTGHFLGQRKIDFDNKLLFLFALGIFFQYTVLRQT